MEKFLSKKLVQRLIFVTLAFSVLASIGLSILVHYIPVAKTDLAISTEIQGNQSHALYVLMRAVSFVGDPLVAAGTIIVAALFLIGIQYQREALFMLLVPIADLAGTIVKNIIDRPRPSDFFVKIYTQTSGSSFPSGHVIHVVMFFGYVFALLLTIKTVPSLLRWAGTAFSIFMIIFISISRIYLGAHWASDVIGGYLIAFPLLAALLLAYFKITSPRQL
jgi:undecaprenyl-diphosphatase